MQLEVSTTEITYVRLIIYDRIVFAEYTHILIVNCQSGRPIKKVNGTGANDAWSHSDY